MYQNCCKKCGSVSFHTEEKGNNIGLYCDNCGSWIKWLGKNELRIFMNSKKESAKKEKVFDETLIITELNSFIDFLDRQIDNELCRTPLSEGDNIMKCAYAHAYEKDKNALLNIISGRHWNENE